MNVLSEMTALAFRRPTAGTDVETVAAWYEAKARLHEHLARQGGSDSGREAAIAAKAHERSRQLLRQARLDVA